jgi:CubicO group peptidase (beta-lactamase class C family)
MRKLNRTRVSRLAAGLVLTLLACTATLQAQTEPRLSPEAQARVDGIAQRVLARRGAPSASIAIVKDGEIVYVRAYGDARLEPRLPARPEMRYSIGSISKQFAAAAILLLAEQGKLSLDDPVSRFVPNLTRANEVTIRQLLSHTAGYQDYWPQDYVPPFMIQDVTADQILERWARRPLDFEPGTQWQYSNTGYVIAGLIIEKASGTPLLQFLTAQILAPLGMQSVLNVDQSRLTESDPTGYFRYALGPQRVAPKEGKGWLFAAGELAMTAEDLAKWDIAMIGQRLLKAESYKEMQTAVKLKNGESTRYGLGISINPIAGHRALSHGGGVSGFSSQNIVFPDDRAAVAVLTNSDGSGAAGEIARQIVAVLFPGDAKTLERQQRALEVFRNLQRNVIDRSLFTANANSYFGTQALKDFAASLGPLGPPDDFTQVNQAERGGMTLRVYHVAFSRQTLNVFVREMPDGKIEQFQVSPAD